ncbi:hypothetical protein HAHE_27640 [Haloferula helveola]|uniref:PDZ domain-containing protein n=1 Tax=Haloferula helveola TaxID=490095 RepID=A0ABN6H5C4_9BACT|nr:hypothetical protein HAHE_27640 [Haloferula helveola]
MSRIFLIGIFACATSVLHAAESYYKEPQLFSTAPSPEKSSYVLGRFGPVGMSIELVQPAFTMKVAGIEEGSPAAATGKLAKGQVIESINGEKLADIDPRIQLARILGKAEASDGLLKFAIRGESEPVVVKVPVLGAYSEGWPLDCPKSDKVVRDFADYLSKPDSDKGFSDIGMLFLLSTGDEKDLAVVREWARGLDPAKAPNYAWFLGYGGPGLCEYYLRTGDKDVLPTIQAWANEAVAGQYNDSWAGRGGVPKVTYGMGHLNAAATGVVTFLLLAKECGAEVPDHALLGALRHFYRYAGRGGNPYGDDRPEVGFVDNGKNGLLAFAMAAAVSLTPEGEESVYADARDIAAMQSFYTTTFMLHGHTGGGIGEIWRSAAMGLMHDRRPKQYRDFMDSRRWHYELSRRFDGSFGILGGAGYDKVDWGGGYGFAYTVPRKKLRIFGAPPTQYSKPYRLPERPWGTAADEEFLSLDPVAFADGTVPDFSGETIAEDSSMPLLRKLHGEGEVSDDMLRRYMHHPDHNIRFVAANKVLGVNSGYIGWRAPGGEMRKELMKEFLASKSVRVRRAMLAAIAETMRREHPEDLLTEDIFGLAIDALKNSDESWFIKDSALQVVGYAPADWVAPQVDLLLPFLKHEEAWLRNGALHALTPVVADPRCYEKVIPAVGELIRTNQRASVTLGMMGAMRAKINEAGPEPQMLAKEVLKETYTGYEGVTTAPGGQDISSTLDAHLEYIAGSLAEVPGGLDVLYEIARERYPNEILPYKDYFLNADPKEFGPKLKAAITPIIMDELIPAYVGKNRKKLEELAASKVQSPFPGGPDDAIDGLSGLYDRAGHDEYNWEMWVNLREAEWSYLTFDPIPSEQVPFDQLITRYREVTLPDGTADWFKPEFDAPGWKTGKSPFGQYNGKLPDPPVSKCSENCVGPICFGATPVNTLWDKEVLLMRGTFDIPPVKEGHRYRVQVNGGDHVGMGGGYAIYINGKLLIEQDSCTGRGGGEKPKGGYITQEFLDDFKGGKVTIAAKSFLRYNDKYKVKPTEKIPQGRISLHLEQMKLPPMGEDLLRKSATVVAMMSSEWQSKLDPESDEQDPDDNLFRWDGKFVANPAVEGEWKVIAEVSEIPEFDPEKKRNARRAPFSSIKLSEGGLTDDPAWLWSGDMLMDLTRYQALRMRVESIGGTEYLFVESGGFSTRNKPEWKSGWYVLAR